MIVGAALLGCQPPQGPTPGPAGDPGGAEVAICGPDEPGERLVFGGKVLDYDGRPLAGAAVMAYHADRAGLYNRSGSATRVPRLRGVAITGPTGEFRFTTIRPGPYPDGPEPAHVHVGVMAPAHRVRDLAYWFADDPLTQDAGGRGDAPGTVIVRPTRRPDGTWSFRHDIRLEGN